MSNNSSPNIATFTVHSQSGVSENTGLSAIGANLADVGEQSDGQTWNEALSMVELVEQAEVVQPSEQATLPEEDAHIGLHSRGKYGADVLQAPTQEFDESTNSQHSHRIHTANVADSQPIEINRFGIENQASVGGQSSINDSVESQNSQTPVVPSSIQPKSDAHSGRELTTMSSMQVPVSTEQPERTELVAHNEFTANKSVFQDDRKAVLPVTPFDVEGGHIDPIARPHKSNETSVPTTKPVISATMVTNIAPETQQVVGTPIVDKTDRKNAIAGSSHFSSTDEVSMNRQGSSVIQTRVSPAIKNNMRNDIINQVNPAGELTAASITDMKMGISPAKGDSTAYYPDINGLIANADENSQTEALNASVTRGVSARVTGQHTTHYWSSSYIDTSQAKWGQELVALLSDKVSLQVGQQVNRAEIRLDPPQLGAIEMVIEIDGESTKVQLTASNSQIREAMQQNIEQLRHQLLQGQSAGQLDVNVRDGKEQQRQQEQSLDTSANFLASEEKVEEEVVLTQRSWLNRTL